jgi:hypothetical protein
MSHRIRRDFADDRVDEIAVVGGTHDRQSHQVEAGQKLRYVKENRCRYPSGLLQLRQNSACNLDNIEVLAALNRGSDGIWSNSASRTVKLGFVCVFPQGRMRRPQRYLSAPRRSPSAARTGRSDQDINCRATSQVHLDGSAVSRRASRKWVRAVWKVPGRDGQT